MGLNFPTAFWKDSNPSDSSDSSDGVSINWDLYLYYSAEISDGPLGPIPWEGPENVNTAGIETAQQSFPNIAESAFPYIVSTFAYYPGYKTDVLSTNLNKSFFGWYLTGYDRGGEVNDLEGYHRANPFILDDNGRELNLFFEADRDTVVSLGRGSQYGSSSEPRDYEAIFNGFIQSGYAEGSFTLTSVSDLSIKVSGLGEMHRSGMEKMHLSLAKEGEEDEIDICSGCSPGEDVNNPWDMNQVMLFKSDGTQEPAVYANRDQPNTKVDQDNRRFGYTTEAGQGTFTVQNLLPGQHNIKIYFNSNDGQYNSGAFYGFKFTFS